MEEIRRVHAKIGVLERRMMHLEERLREPHRRASSIDFDKAEIGALRDAIRALRLVGLVQDAELDPVLVIDELCAVITEGGGEGRRSAALDRAERCVAALDVERDGPGETTTVEGPIVETRRGGLR